MVLKEIFINGPINVVRLNGDVGNLNKTIYLFMDVHEYPNNQTKCDDIRSEDVAKYVVDVFDQARKENPKLTYDFFMERGPLRPYLYNKKYKGNYLQQMSEFFIKSFNIDVTKKLVQKSSSVPNVRFHYADIRDFVIDWTKTRDILFSHNLWNEFNLNNFIRVHDDINFIKYEILEMYNVIYKDTDIINPKIEKIFFSPYANIRPELPKDFFDIYTKKVIYKIRKSYQDNNIKKKINMIIDSDLLNIFNNFFDRTEQAISRLQILIEEHKKIEGYDTWEILLRQNDNTYDYGLSWINRTTDIVELINHIQLIYNEYANIGVMLMDLYLLRRFLDKKYITNAIAYTGASHSCNYIRLLVKYFGFSITHYSYLKDDNIKKNHEIIKKTNKMQDLNVIFFPIIFLQCSDMTNFPPLFT
jgi:hypothetical protein